MTENISKVFIFGKKLFVRSSVYFQLIFLAFSGFFQLIFLKYARVHARERKRERKQLRIFYWNFNKQTINHLEYILCLSLDYVGMHRPEEFEEHICEAYLGFLRYMQHCARKRFDIGFIYFARAKYIKISWISRCAREWGIFFRPGISQAGARSQFRATSMSRMSSIAGPPDWPMTDIRMSDNDISEARQTSGM